MPVSGNTAISNQIISTGSTGLASVRYNPVIASDLVWTDGTGAGQINKHGSASVGTAGANEDVDLAGGTHLKDASGGNVSFAAIKAFTIHAPDTNTNDVTIGGHGTADWVGAINLATPITLPPGGTIHLQNPSAAGWAVTAGTSDIIRIAVAAATTDKVQLIFGGI